MRKIITLITAFVVGKIVDKEVNRLELEDWEKGLVKLVLCPLTGFIIGLIARKTDK